MKTSDKPELTSPPLWRQVLPWVVAILFVGIVLLRVDVDEVLAQLVQVSIPAYVIFMTVAVTCNLLLDSLASWRVYRMVAPNLSYRELLLVRGASYLPATVNFHIGQAYLTYLLAQRHKVPLARVASATLLSYATFFGVVIAISATSLPLSVWAPQSSVTIDWGPSYLGSLLVAGVAYLLVLRLNPRVLRERSLLTALFSAGISGHLRLCLWRLPYALLLVLQLWLAYAFFDVSPPIVATLVVIPLILLVSALPLTPKGIGTRELVAVSLLAEWAKSEAAIVAAGTAMVAVTMVVQALIGIVCTPFSTSYMNE